MALARRTSGRIRGSALGCAGLLALMAHPAAADTQLHISATVLPSCQVEAAPLAFGAVASAAASADAQASLSLDCTPDTAFTVTMDGGRNGDRRMAGEATGALLAYELYSDPARTRRWRDVAAVSPADGTLRYAVYGRITEARARADRYADVVTVTLSF